MYYLLNFFTAIVFVRQAFTYTWIEQLTIIEKGIYSGNNGYPRGYISRSDPGFTADMMVHLVPPSSSSSSDILCASTQGLYNQTNYPRLQVSPGDYFAMKYLENGIITNPPPRKPTDGGSVYVFGTYTPSSSEKLSDVLQWTADGTGGDKRGTLLTVQEFDDKRCYQINTELTSMLRQHYFPDIDAGGTLHDQWCEADVQVPGSLSVSSVYTIYWVWKWPTQGGPDEYYTTCSDLSIITNQSQGFPSNPLAQQDPQRLAVSDYENRAAQTTPLISTSFTSTSSTSSTTFQTFPNYLTVSI